MRAVAESLTNGLDLLEMLTASQQSLLVLAVLVIVFMLVEPAGLRGVWLRLKCYFPSWPFRYEAFAGPSVLPALQLAISVCAGGEEA